MGFVRLSQLVEAHVVQILEILTAVLMKASEAVWIGRLVLGFGGIYCSCQTKRLKEVDVLNCDICVLKYMDSHPNVNR
jgi:hypothetical protein